MFEKIFSIVGIILSFIAMGVALNYAITENEEQECLVWAQEYRQYESYYFASWQYAQCEALKINIITN